MKPRIILFFLTIIFGIGTLIILKNQQRAPHPPEQVATEAKPTTQVTEVLPEQTLIPRPKLTPSPQPIISSTTPGSIAGRVTTQDGTPITGCEVIFFSKNTRALDSFIKRGRYLWNEPFAITDATGYYCGKSLFPASYNIAFIASGYVYAGYPKSVLVPPGKTIEGIDQVLEPGGTIFGVVTENLSGRPIERVRVLAKHISGDYPDRYKKDTAICWPREFTVFSDKEGKFKLDYLPKREDYDLLAKHRNYAPVRKEAIRVGSNQSIKIVMSPCGSIKGKVVCDNPNLDLKQTRVNCYLDEELVRIVRCKDDGSFYADRLPPGTYHLLADHEAKLRSKMSDPVYVGFRSEVFGIELRLERPPTVSGRVIDKQTRQGIERVRIQLINETVLTDAEGNFVIEVMKRGWVRPNISPPDPYIYPPWQETIPITVEDDNIEDVLIELSAGGRVRGKVLAQSGEGIKGILVEAFMKMEDGRWEQSQGQTETRDEGIFELSRLGPHENYRLEAKLLPPSKKHHHPRNQKGLKTAISEPFSLAEGEIKEDLILQLESHASISGMVEDAHGNPLGEGYHLAFNQILPEGNRFISHTQPNGQGFYFSNELPAGEIAVSISGFHPHDNPSLRCTVNEKKVVTTQAGLETSGVDFIVQQKKGYRLSGRVVDDEGKGTPKRWIWVMENDDFSDPFNIPTVAKGITDEGGFFQGEDIPAGRYFLWVSGNHDYHEGFLERVECPAEGLEIVTPRFARVRGQVVSRSTGKPVKRFQIGFSGDPGRMHWFTEKLTEHFHEQGNFRLDYLPPTPIMLKIKTPDEKLYNYPLNLKPGEVLEDLVIEVD